MLLLSLAGPRWVTDTGLNNRFPFFRLDTFTTNVIAPILPTEGYGRVRTPVESGRANEPACRANSRILHQWVNWDVTTQTETPGVFYQCPRHNWAIWQELPREAGSTVLSGRRWRDAAGNEKLVVD